MSQAKVLEECVSSIDKEGSEVEIVSVLENCISERDLRKKLFEFLLKFPPPVPLQWRTFRDYVVYEFHSYYPIKIIKEIYSAVEKLTKEMVGKGEDVMIVSDAEDEEIVQPKTSRSGDEPESDGKLEPCSSPEEDLDRNSAPRNHSLSNNVGKLNSRVGSRSQLSLKKHQKYVKGIYDLLKDIKESTTCKVCLKLNSKLSKLSNSIKKSYKPVEASSSKVGDRVVAKKKTRRKTLGDQPESCDSILSEREADLLRQSMFFDKILEIALPSELSSPERASIDKKPPTTMKRCLKMKKITKLASIKPDLECSKRVNSNKRKTRNHTDTSPSTSKPAKRKTKS